MKDKEDYDVIVKSGRKALEALQEFANTPGGLKQQEPSPEDLKKKKYKQEELEDVQTKSSQESEQNLPEQISNQQELKKKALMQMLWQKEVKNKLPHEVFLEAFKEKLGDDPVLNAQIILEVTKGIKLDDPRNKTIVDGFEKIYDEKVRGNAPKKDMPQFDDMYTKLSPKKMGRWLFRDTYKDKSVKDLQTKSPVKEGHQTKLEKAATLLQANVRKTETGLPELNPKEKEEAAKNLVSNLSFKQMSNVVKTMEGYEDYSQKSWLKKAVTRFVDVIRSNFSSAKTMGIAGGVDELMKVGAGRKIEQTGKTKTNVVEEPKSWEKKILNEKENKGKGGRGK